MMWYHAVSKKFFPNTLRSAVAVCCGLLLTACASDSESFSNFPGFTQYFAKYKPIDAIPNQQQQLLLEKYQPRIYLSVSSDGIAQQGPVDFYKDYISDGRLLVDGQVISQQVTAELLNQYRDNQNAKFEYTGGYRKDSDAVVYARFDTDTLIYKDTEIPLEFLSYNLVFPTSGMLKGLGTIKTLGLTIAGSLNDWHQLDHYVGLTIALRNERPIAITLQQHNYQTTYLIDVDLTLPADHRVQVDVAMRSNELYLHNKTETRHPAVSFVADKNIEFINTGNNKPFMAGFDITRGDKELNYQLQYLPQTDAFYQFKGHLGKSRLLPGRDGPPGADYTTLPGLMPRAVRMATGYRAGSVEEEKEKIATLIDFENFRARQEGIDAYIKDFIDALP